MATDVRYGQPDDRARIAGRGRISQPAFENPAFVIPPPLSQARVGLVTSAGLHHPEDRGWQNDEQTFRVLNASRGDLQLGHLSSNFDRSGLLADLNVVLPFQRLAEMAAEGVIGSVADRQISFMGALGNTSLSSVVLDSGPAAGRLLRSWGVDVVLLTPV